MKVKIKHYSLHGNLHFSLYINLRGNLQRRLFSRVCFGQHGNVYANAQCNVHDKTRP